MKIKILAITLFILTLAGCRYEVSADLSERKVYTSQKECERQTGKICDFQMCDYVPEGKTIEEVCGKNFQKGWTVRLN